MPLKKKTKKVIKKKTKKIIKKKVIKRVIKKKPVEKAVKKTVKKIKEDILGIVTHYFPKVRAAVIKLKAPLNVGDKLKIKGHTTDFTQIVSSLQIDRVDITSAKKGQEIGLLVNSRVRQEDKVYKL